MEVFSVVVWFDGSGYCCCWFTISVCLETDVVAFSGVSLIVWVGIVAAADGSVAAAGIGAETTVSATGLGKIT